MNSCKVALGYFVVVSAIVSACVSEPDGIHREETQSEQGGEAAAGGQPSEDASPSVACEVLSIVQTKCGRCHASPPLYGAPFPLLTFDDLAEVDDKGRVRRERMVTAIERGTMPATFLELDPPVEELSEEERALLLEWLTSDEEAPALCDE
jgi:uncharacterized membrane protein